MQEMRSNESWVCGTRISGGSEKGNQKVNILGLGLSYLLTRISKRDGLEKAVYRIEQAIKKSKTQGSHSGDDENIHQLKSLLNDANQILPRTSSENLNPPFSIRGSSTQAHQSPQTDNFIQPGPGPLPDQNSDDHFAVDDAENPLQLLARASDLSVPSNAQSVSSSATRDSRGHARDRDLEAFFGPFHPSLDVGEDIDPIEMGIVTEKESSGLFT